MENVLHIGGEIVDLTYLVLFAAMDDGSGNPAVVLSFDLVHDCATIETRDFEGTNLDVVKVGQLDPITLFDLTLGECPAVSGDRAYYKYVVPEYTFQVHTLDVSKAGWSDGLRLYEWAGLTDWRDPKYKRLRNWKHAWWQIVLDTFDLDMDI